MEEEHKYENFDLFHWSDPYYNGSYRYYFWNALHLLLTLFYRDLGRARTKLDPVYYRVHQMGDKVITWCRSLLLWLLVIGLVSFLAGFIYFLFREAL